VRRAAWLLALAVVMTLADAAAFAWTQHVSAGTALYWAVTTAATVGYGDVTPHSGAGRVVAVITMLTTIPLLAGVWSLLTGVHVSSLTHTKVAAHMRDEIDDVRRSAQAAHRIAADLFERHTGERHPDAPDDR
jgi:voltage-gated potassium channel